jgi:hypothetical protein
MIPGKRENKEERLLLLVYSSDEIILDLPGLS